MKKVLTIAGSDCSGGAGIQADLKTMSAHKIYGMSVITALTAQNTMGVTGIADVTPEFVALQMDAVFKDIFPDAVKIGMVSNGEIIKVIAEKLKEYGAKNIVLDPVMVSTSGSKLLSDNTIEILLKNLFPLADVLTPNLSEAEVLANMKIETEQDMIDAGKKIAQFTKGTVLIKGGHLSDSADDLIIDNGQVLWIKGDRIDNPNTHGTGCTLSSAIASNIAIGNDKIQSIKLGKEYVTNALKSMLDLGNGSGPLNHCFK